MRVSEFSPVAAMGFLVSVYARNGAVLTVIVGLLEERKGSHKYKGPHQHGLY